MNPLPTNLINNALALTGKTMEDMNLNPILCKFHMPNFYAYLLSPEFIEKYSNISINFDRRQIADKNDKNYKDSIASDIWYKVYEHQRRDDKFPEWNPEPLIDLLSKI